MRVCDVVPASRLADSPSGSEWHCSGASFAISIGTTIVDIVLTPWGKQSGGHLNPAMTLTLYRLGRMDFWDGIFYGVAQTQRALALYAVTLETRSPG